MESRRVRESCCVRCSLSSRTALLLCLPAVHARRLGAVRRNPWSRTAPRCSCAARLRPFRLARRAPLPLGQRPATHSIRRLEAASPAPRPGQNTRYPLPVPELPEPELPEPEVPDPKFG
jgi:hypothetical protein